MAYNNLIKDVSYMLNPKLTEKTFIKCVNSLIKSLSSYYEDYYFTQNLKNKLSTIVSLYTNGIYRISSDSDLPAPAGIIFEKKRVYFNFDTIRDCLFSSLPFVLANYKTFDFVFVNKQGSLYFDFDEYCFSFAAYLVFHELGHYFYTSKNSLKIYSSVSNNSKIPFEFIKFVGNVVEDSFIQRKFQLDNPIQKYRDYFLLGTSIIQGPFAVLTWEELFKDSSNNLKPMKIKDKLFYFILRAYNLNNRKVQEVYGTSSVLGWTNECIEYFDTAICILDSEERCSYTCNVLVPALFDVLHEVVNVTKQQMQNNGNGSLLDEDKLREANIVEDNSSNEESDENSSENDSESANGNSSSSGSKTDSRSNKGSNSGDSKEESEDDSEDFSDDSSEQESSKSDEDSDEEKDEETSSGSFDSEEEDEESDSEDEAESGETDDVEHDEDYERSWGPDDKEEEDSEDDESKESGSEDSDSNSSLGNQDDEAQNNSSIEDAMEKLENSFIDEVSEASKELNESLFESEDRDYSSYEENSDFFTKPADVDASALPDILNNIVKYNQVIGDQKSFAEILKNEGSYAEQMSKISSFGLDLLNTASNLFKRIYTYDTDDLNYLDNGELDEENMIDFYTEKSINIFKQHLDLVESKKIKVYFVVDDSSSMYPERAGALSIVIPPLIHAFEESHIETCLYTFSDSSYLIKDFKDKAVLLGDKSNIQYFYNLSRDSCCTYIAPALSAISMREVEDDTIYLMFVFSDGALHDEDLAEQLFYYLSTEKHFNLFGVTIESPSQLRKLREIMRVEEDCCKNYSNGELITVLPQDIYSTIVEKFVKK